MLALAVIINVRKDTWSKSTKITHMKSLLFLTNFANCKSAANHTANSSALVRGKTGANSKDLLESLHSQVWGDLM